MSGISKHWTFCK